VFSHRQAIGEMEAFFYGANYYQKKGGKKITTTFTLAA
jgi:hypothetical protein